MDPWLIAGMVGVALIIGLTLIHPTLRKYATHWETIRKLRKHRIPFEQWEHTDKTNSLDTLIEWIDIGEAWLEEEGDELVLHQNVVVVSVYCHPLGSPKLLLREYRDGRMRPFPGSLGEKFSPDAEEPIVAARRALVEELGQCDPGFKDPQITLEYIGHERSERIESEYFPGLQDVYHREIYQCEIPRDLYRQSYQATEKGRRVTFSWVLEREEKSTPCLQSSRD